MLHPRRRKTTTCRCCCRSGVDGVDSDSPSALPFHSSFVPTSLHRPRELKRVALQTIPTNRIPRTHCRGVGLSLHHKTQRMVLLTGREGDTAIAPPHEPKDRWIVLRRCSAVCLRPSSFSSVSHAPHPSCQRSTRCRSWRNCWKNRWRNCWKSYWKSRLIHRMNHSLHSTTHYHSCYGESSSLFPSPF